MYDRALILIAGPPRGGQPAPRPLPAATAIAARIRRGTKQSAVRRVRWVQHETVDPQLKFVLNWTEELKPMDISDVGAVIRFVGGGDPVPDPWDKGDDSSRRIRLRGGTFNDLIDNQVRAVSASDNRP